jgi:hypothetical protein
LLVDPVRPPLDLLPGSLLLLDSGSLLLLDSGSLLLLDFGSLLKKRERERERERERDVFLIGLCCDSSLPGDF